jgi:hypothetical protein
MGLSLACALDGGVAFGGTLRAYVENKGIIEIKAKRPMKLMNEKDRYHRVMTCSLVSLQTTCPAGYLSNGKLCEKQLREENLLLTSFSKQAFAD